MRFNNEVWHNEARWQGCCQGTAEDGSRCERTGRFNAHHVVYEQHVRRLRPELKFDPRNCLRLCTPSGYPTDGCHGDQHSGKRRVKIEHLHDENIEFAIELMGVDKAIAYFARYYDGHPEQDARIRAHLGLAEAA